MFRFLTPNTVKYTVNTTHETGSLVCINHILLEYRLYSVFVH